MTGAGTGYSTWGDTRSPPGRAIAPRTPTASSSTCAISTAARSGRSATSPSPAIPPRRTARYTPGCVTIERRDADIASRLDVCVAPDADVEVRRLTLRNRAQRPRRIEVTTYLEVVLNARGAHAAHPAFSKLFVETEFEPAAARCWRAAGRAAPASAARGWLRALLGAGRAAARDRPRPLRSAAAARCAAPRALTGADAALRHRRQRARSGLRAAPRRRARRRGERALRPAARRRAPTARRRSRRWRAPPRRPALGDASVERAARAGARAAGAARTSTTRTAEAFQELAGALLYGHPALARRRGDDRTRAWRAGADLAVRSRRRAVSLVRADRAADARSVARAAHRARLLGGARACASTCSSCAARGVDPAQAAALAPRRRAAARLRAARDELPAADVDVAARLCARWSLGAEHRHAWRWAAGRTVPAGPTPSVASHRAPPPPSTAARPAAGAAEQLRFDNGVGGFTADGTRVRHPPRPGAHRPPLPWINVVANETFGFLVSESGAGYTWSRNSREHRLTPWSNDPVRDPHGEALYVRDEEQRRVLVAAAGPGAGAAPRTRCGTASATRAGGTAVTGSTQEVVAFVAARRPGAHRARPPHQRGGRAAARLGLLVPAARPRRARRARARATWSASTMPTAACCWRATASTATSATAWCSPRRWRRRGGAHRLDGRSRRVPRPQRQPRPRRRRPTAAAPSTAAPAPGSIRASRCSSTFEIAPGATVECAFLLGETADRAAAARLVAALPARRRIDAALDDVREFWRTALTAVQVETPVPAIDLMVNGWLLYQTLSCRLWGRSAFYQSGGAFGFRDQLQDAAALVYVAARADARADPAARRAPVRRGRRAALVAPAAGRGIRTRFSDDLLWLPYVAALLRAAPPATGACSTRRSAS